MDLNNGLFQVRLVRFIYSLNIIFDIWLRDVPGRCFWIWCVSFLGSTLLQCVSVCFLFAFLLPFLVWRPWRVSLTVFSRSFFGQFLDTLRVSEKYTHNFKRKTSIQHETRERERVWEDSFLTCEFERPRRLLPNIMSPKHSWTKNEQMYSSTISVRFFWERMSKERIIVCLEFPWVKVRSELLYDQ